MSTGDQPDLKNFGELLSAARHKKDMTSADVANTLKLPLDKIDAIERSDIHALPVAAFTSGYLRAYAKLVDVSEDEVVDSYNRLSGSSSSSAPGAVSDLPAQATSDHLGMRVVSFALISLVIVLFIMWLQGRQPGSGSESLTVAEPEQVVKEETVEKVESIKLPVAGADVPDSTNLSGESVQNQTLPEQSSLVDQETVAAVSEKGSAEETKEDKQRLDSELALNAAIKPNPVAPEGDDQLVISANGNCWAEITDSNGHLLYRGLLKGGDTPELKGAAPFNIFLGDASVVSLAINDNVIDITRFVRSNNTARFKLYENRAERNGLAKSESSVSTQEDSIPVDTVEQD